jgi:glycosyltransferase involved in cell wall biosynthesis
MKHNPALLLELARHFQDEERAQVVVISEGLGADWLREKKAKLGVDNLLLLPFQPFENMPDVLASSDVLVAILEPDAGVFSVPSKVLTYLCAGKPILAVMPPENLAARIIEKAGAGIVEKPGEVGAFMAAGKRLQGDPGLRRRAGASARSYAENAFDIKRVADAFVAVLTS